MGGKRTQPRSCGSGGWKWWEGCGHGPGAPPCQHHRCHLPTAPSVTPTCHGPMRPPRTPRSPQRSQWAQPLCKPLFQLVLRAPRGAPALCFPKNSTWGALAAPPALHRNGGTRDAPNRGLPRTGPPWQHSGHGEPPTVPLVAPPASPRGLGTTRTLRRERGVSRDPRVETPEWGSRSGGPGTWRPQHWASQHWGPRHRWQPEPTDPQPRGSPCPSPAVSVFQSPHPQPWRSPVPGPGVPAPPCPHPPEPGPATSSSPLPPPLPPRPTRPAASPAAARPGQPSLGGTGGSGPQTRPCPAPGSALRRGAVSSVPPALGHPRAVLTCGHEGVFGCPRGLGAGLLLLLVELGGRRGRNSREPRSGLRSPQSPPLLLEPPTPAEPPRTGTRTPPGAAGQGSPSPGHSPAPKGWQKG